MSSFPGSMYDASGTSLDPTIPDLLQEQLDAYLHRSMVTRDHGTGPIARVWPLADDAMPDAIPPIIMAEAVTLVLADQAVVILAQRPEPEVDARAALLHALNLSTAPEDVVGRV